MAQKFYIIAGRSRPHLAFSLFEDALLASAQTV
jgi:hypothetical protein